MWDMTEVYAFDNSKDETPLVSTLHQTSILYEVSSIRLSIKRTGETPHWKNNVIEIKNYLFKVII